jgi:CBS domain-containing protein
MTTVRQLLDRKGGRVFSIAPEARVLEALRIMAEHGIGALVVLDGERLAGVMSERDYARKVTLQGKSSSDTPVRDIMTERVVTVSPAQTVADCMAVMTEKHIRHLPVVDGGKVIGVLSIGDLVKAVIAEQADTIRALESYIHN